MIDSLPAEVLIQILEEAYEEWNRSPNLLRVCRRWQILAEPIIWRRFEITQSLFGEKLIRKLEDYPRFRQYVRKLEIFNLRTAARANQALDIMQLCLNLREVTIKGSTKKKRRRLPCRPPHLLDTLRKLPFLQKLELEGLRRPTDCTGCYNADTSIPANRQKGRLRSLRLSNIELDSDLLNYLFSLPSTLETFESYYLFCPSCHDQTCQQSLQQRLLDTNQRTLHKIVLMDHYPTRQPPRFPDFSSLMRVEALRLDSRKGFAGDLYEVYYKLPAPQPLRLDLELSVDGHQRSYERSFGHLEKIFLEQFLLTLKSAGLHGELRHIHLHYNPDPAFDWSWDHAVDAEILAAKLGFYLTYDQPYYTKREWEDFRQRKHGEYVTSGASICVPDSKEVGTASHSQLNKQ